MSLIITPGALIDRAELYHQLGALLQAGLPMIKALETLQKNPANRSFRAPLAVVIQGIQTGETFTSALRQLGSWTPAFDLSLIEAGEKSGRLDVCLKLLAEYYRQRAKMMKDIIGASIYPVFMLHFAVLLFPMNLFTGLILKGETWPFLIEKILIFGPLYGGGFALAYACQGQRGEYWRSILEQVTHPIPLLGRCRRALALARLASALESLINAGVGIIQAWELAAASSGSPALHREIKGWLPRLEAGSPPSELLAISRNFPELFVNLYCSGEVSGKIDDTLSRLFLHYHEEGTRLAHLLAQWIPRILYGCVAIYVAFQIIGFYAGYFKMLDDVMK